MNKGISLISFMIMIFIILVIIMITVNIINEINYNDREGIIINKYYEKSYMTTFYIWSGKVMIPHQMYHPESWNFKLQKEIDGKVKTISIEVSEEIYNQYNVGDYFRDEE